MGSGAALAATAVILGGLISAGTDADGVYGRGASKTVRVGQETRMMTPAMQRSWINWDETAAPDDEPVSVSLAMGEACMRAPVGDI